MKGTFHVLLSSALVASTVICGAPSISHAQQTDAPAPLPPAPDRSKTWGGISDVTAVSALGVALLMPRLYYPDNELTLGWKARWHVSVLAPVMTYATLSLINEQYLKDEIKGDRPGCDQGFPHGVDPCKTYGGPSTHAFAAGSALGHGLAVFLFDMDRSNGQVSALSVVGNIAVPLVLGTFTVVGRAAGNYEDGGQIAAGALPGLGIGFLLGMAYASMQRPECGYSGGLICW